MELGNVTKKVQCWVATSGHVGLCILWYSIHIILGIWRFTVAILNSIESYFILSGFISRCKTLNAHKVKYLAIVVDSEEARQIHKVIELLHWLKAVGMRNVCLYDADGVLKNSKEIIMESLTDAKLYEEVQETDAVLKQGQITLEFVSASDGKEAVAKAANALLKKNSSRKDRERPVFSEPDITEALKNLGYGGPEPDLLLVYAPARCHLGFPPWRTRYTEFVHMGTLKAMKYGSLIKAIYKFTMVHQNYGT